jgi:hypothetical protein
VEPGGTLIVHVTVRNGRSVQVPYSGAAALTLRTNLPLPNEPFGKTWTGIEGDPCSR